MLREKSILCFGEVLWDILPSGIFLGGAPLNVACHLANMNCKAIMLSSLGKDLLGTEALERIENYGVNTQFIQKHNNLPTGTVKVNLDQKGNANYTIREPVAWDLIDVDDNLLEAAQAASAIVYGTLALRSKHNLTQLEKILNFTNLLKIIDLNLRPPFDDLAIVFRLIAHADVLKLNETELATLTNKPTQVENNKLHDAIKTLADLTGKNRICVTLGEKGALFYNRGSYVKGICPVVDVRDTVGAGDAFMAAFTEALISGEADVNPGFLDRCCRLGAFVASQNGAVPNRK